ncbi:MAG: family 78 glycoside hydrolase catalytic domain [Haliscomenobacter sp.]|nr:family 78 glycoside hydrolase catalytic domain [Haliscomenobacter sp.]
MPWKHVAVANYGYQNLVGLESVPVRRIQELQPVRIFRTPDHTLVADMGQNMVGWVPALQGPAGAHIRLRHAEVLDKSGNLYTDNLRGAKQEINYTLRGAQKKFTSPILPSWASAM